MDALQQIRLLIGPYKNSPLSADMAENDKIGCKGI